MMSSGSRDISVRMPKRYRMGKDVVLVLGVSLVILAVVGQVKTPHFEVGVRSKGKRTLLGMAGVALGVAYFSSDLATLYRYIFPPPAMPVVVIDEIDSSALTQDARYIGDKIHRNLAELLSTAGHRVIAPPLSVVAGSSTDRVEKRFSISLAPDGSNLAVHVALTTPDGSILASTELTGAVSELKEIYKVLPEAILFGLDVDERTLKLRNTAKRPTERVEALAYYLYARRSLAAGDVNSAQSALKRAILADRNFALAYWSLGVLMSDQGMASEGQDFIQEASSIDPDHPKIPLTAAPRMSNPVPSLMSAVLATRGQVQELGPGFSFAKAASKEYGVEIRVWTVDPVRFDIGLAEQKNANGSSTTEFLEDAKAILSLNGGFFDIDESKRLNPAGVLVVNGIIRNASPNRQSGAFVRDSEGVRLIWAKDLGRLDRYNFVLQTGPVLVEGPGKLGIRRNDHDRLNRSAICASGGAIMFAVLLGSDRKGLSLYEFAELLAAREADGGLGCDFALNLDGGPSTQFAMNFRGIREQVDGLWKVQNAIVVKKSPNK